MQDSVPAVASTATHGVDLPVNNLEDAVNQLIAETRKTGVLKHGVKEVVRAIEDQTAHIVFLAADVTEQKIIALVNAIAKEKNIPVVSVPNAEKLGRSCGRYMLDRDGNERKVLPTSCCAILKLQHKTQAYSFIDDHIKKCNA